MLAGAISWGFKSPSPHQHSKRLKGREDLCPLAAEVKLKWNACERLYHTHSKPLIRSKHFLFITFFGQVSTIFCLIFCDAASLLS